MAKELLDIHVKTLCLYIYIFTFLVTIKNKIMNNSD